MIKIQRAGNLENIIRIVYSPLSELALALDLLSSPDHHKLHLHWASAILEKLSQKEKDQLRYFEKLIDGYLNLDMHINYLTYPYDGELESSLCSAFLSNSDNWITDLDSGDREQLSSFLRFIWENYIYPVIDEHKMVIERQKQAGRTLLKESGHREFFRKINDRISFTKNGHMKIEKWVESTFEAGELRDFYIELSLFAFPHLVISDRHGEGSFWLSWDVPFRGDKIIAPGIEKISSKAFALSDKSRLRILLMLCESPTTQKDLTRQMGFAKSTISRHISILLEAGLIIPEEGGRNVRLKLNRDSLSGFSGEILRWIE